MSYDGGKKIDYLNCL